MIQQLVTRIGDFSAFGEGEDEGDDSISENIEALAQNLVDGGLCNFSMLMSNIVYELLLQLAQCVVSKTLRQLNAVLSRICRDTGYALFLSSAVSNI